MVGILTEVLPEIHILRFYTLVVGK